MVYYLFPEVRGMSGLQFAHMFHIHPDNSMENGSPFHGFIINDALAFLTFHFIDSEEHISSLKYFL